VRSLKGNPPPCSPSSLPSVARWHHQAERTAVRDDITGADAWRQQGPGPEREPDNIRYLQSVLIISMLP